MIVWGGASPTQIGALYCASGTANAAPVAASDAYSVPANKITLIGTDTGTLSNDSDANQDLLTAQAISKPAHGACVFNFNGSFLYKPAAGFTGTDSFAYHAYDGVAFSNPATVTITVY
jgi:VCBS repeat-containing protein